MRSVQEHGSCELKAPEAWVMYRVTICLPDSGSRVQLCMEKVIKENPVTFSLKQWLNFFRNSFFNH